jgi:hypothetical protein
MYRCIAFAVLFTAAPADAGKLLPYRGESIELGSIRGDTYYSVSPDGFRVVTTLADGAAGLPVPFEATLADKQRLKVSVPGKAGGQTIALELSRAGDKVIVTRTQASGKE